MGKKPLVTKRMVSLKVYKGNKLSFNEDGSIQNDNQLIKTEYNTSEWKCLMMTLRSSGYCKVEVFNVKDMNNDFSIIEDFKDIEEDVKTNSTLVIKKELTPDQKEIEALKRKLDAFMSKGKEDENEEAKNLQKESKKEATKDYIEAVGKRPLGTWDAETIKEKQELALLKKEEEELKNK